MITAASLQKLVDERNKTLPAGQHFTAIPVAWASRCAAALETERANADLVTPVRIRHFMAQVAHETGGFRKLVESTRYTNPQRLVELFSNVHGVEHARRLVEEGPEAIGCCIYANKLGNGGIESGDGYRFRGRGFLMNTGRANYKDVERYSGLKVVVEPDLLGRPEGAAVAAIAFWKDHHLNAAADIDQVDEVTRIINGKKLEGRANRAAWAQAARAVW